MPGKNDIEFQIEFYCFFVTKMMQKKKVVEESRFFMAQMLHRKQKIL